jgi:hypothetical protein
VRWCRSSDAEASVRCLRYELILHEAQANTCLPHTAGAKNDHLGVVLRGQRHPATIFAVWRLPR